MNETKITLSQKEKQLVTNADWILTKNGILQKIRRLLEQVQAEQAEWLRSKRDTLPPEIFSLTPKISKGENYQGLPYLILDLPRVFEKDKILAIRTMFWWGNFFSVTLHLSGDYKKRYEENIISAYPFLKENEFFTCISPGQWEHHFEASNYIETRKLSRSEFESGIRSSFFVKIANNISLKNWENIERSLMKDFKVMIGLLI